MKAATLATIASSALLASAAPARRWFNYDVATDMRDVIEGEIFADCKDVGVIFAKGTFDSNDIGVWVGPQLREALERHVGSLAFEGVTSDAYPADLAGFLAEGGSESAARSLAQTVTDYVSNCPKSTIIISGWSQGAAVAEKGLRYLTPEVRSKVAGLVTFGDPYNLFYNDPLPAGVDFHTECMTGTLLDPLCANLSADFKWPSSIEDIVGPFSQLPGLAVGVEQTKAAASLVMRFPVQLFKARDAFIAALTDKSKLQRLLLTPQHFTYANNGYVENAANWIASLPRVAGK